MMSLKRILSLVFLALFVGTWAYLPGLSEAKHKHKHKHRYYYYPGQQVYYSPVVKRYYYMDSGTWVTRPAAPRGIQLGKRVFISLDNSVPYTAHPVVIQQYPVIVGP